MTRAASLSLRTFDPAAPSFERLIARVQLELTAICGAPIAFAPMPWSGWVLVMKALAGVRDARAIGGMVVTFELSNEEAGMENHGQQAAAVRLGYTSDGLLRVELLDAGATVFAFADLTADQMSGLIGQGCDLLEIVSKGGLATTQCAGTA